MDSEARAIARRQSAEIPPITGRAGDILAVLATPRFANRPVAKAEEVSQRIAALRADWPVRPAQPTAPGHPASRAARFAARGA